MVDAGHSLPTVRDILGHSSVAITGDFYSDPPDASARSAVDGWAGELGLWVCWSDPTAEPNQPEDRVGSLRFS
jgi:hypothetical protein